MEHRTEENRLPQKTGPLAGDWILEMFSPAFATVENPFEGKVTAESELQPRIRLVSAFDPESIQKVYERVLLMFKADEEIRNQTKEPGMPQTEPGLGAESSVQPDQKVDLNDSTIWNSEELSMLRNVFRAAKDQICELKARLQQAECHNTELKENLRVTAKELQTKSTKLLEATKANHRLVIHVEDLQRQLKGTSMKLDAVTEMWKEIDQEKLHMMKQMVEMRQAADHERMGRKQAELKLQEANQENSREKMIAEENIKAKYEHRIFRLEEEVQKARRDLEEEKELHARSEKALQHLRNHFASLPLEEVLAPNIVAKDQVAQINFIGT